MGVAFMQESDPEKLVVVTSTPEGLAPLTPGERSMIAEEGDQVEQAAFVDHSYPSLLNEFDRSLFEGAKQAFSNSDAHNTLRQARELIGRCPTYLPAHVYEELGMNVGRGRDLKKCVQKCLANIELAQQLIKGHVDSPPTVKPVRPEHVNEMLDMVRYNLSDRYMRLGMYHEALDQVRLSEMLPKGVEAKMKRRMKEASLLYRLKDREASKAKLRQARDMDRELFSILRERMSLDGHIGVDQPL